MDEVKVVKYVKVDRFDDRVALIRLLEQVDKTVGELRAVLAPLLDNPIPSPITRCVFCERLIFDADPWGADGAKASSPAYHAPDCPVLRRDELLGR